MISAASTLMFRYMHMAAIFDILQRENNRTFGVSVIIPSSKLAGLCSPDRIGIWKCCMVFVEGGKPENPEKNPDKNQQQTLPTYDFRSGARTREFLAEASALTTVQWR